MRMLTHPQKDPQKERTLKEVEFAIEEMETIIVDAVRSFYEQTGLEIESLRLTTEHMNTNNLIRFMVVADVPASWERPDKEKKKW